jgi:ABC-type multidrug transport system ATPase subunit
LLDILAGRLVSSKLKGSIYVNGAPRNISSFKRETGYVMQSDALYPLLTVRETLRFAAYLRVHNRTRAEKNVIVDKLIETLRLNDCADTVIGDANTRGISGGEMRRVTIGIDIVHEPKLIFLDEPTSGLDSYTAFTIVSALKRIALDNNSTIVITIHQPSARILSQIDKVIFLSHGRIAYTGAVKNIQTFVDGCYQELGLLEAELDNAAELLLNLIENLTEQNKLDFLLAKFQNSSDEHMAVNAIAEDDREVNYANSFWGDIFILCERSLLNTSRTEQLFVSRLIGFILFAVILGTLFLDSENDSEGVSNKASFFILSVAFFYYDTLEALPIFYAEKTIFQREYASGAYRAISYTISSMLSFLPFLFIMAFIYTMISWWIVGLPNDANIVLFNVLCLFIMLISGTAMTTLVSTLAPEPMSAQSVGSQILATMLIFSGFFINRDLIPDYWIWCHYLSLMKYALDSSIVNAFKDEAYTETMNNNQVLNYYGVDGINKWTGIGVLIAWTLFFRAIFYYRLVTAFNGSRKH